MARVNLPTIRRVVMVTMLMVTTPLLLVACTDSLTTAACEIIDIILPDTNNFTCGIEIDVPKTKLNSDGKVGTTSVPPS